MATYRLKCGFIPWVAAATPLKRSYDWPKIRVWAAVLALCLGFWVVVILACVKAVR